MKKLTKFERDIFRVIINSDPRRSPDGQLKAIMKLVSPTQPQEDLVNEMGKVRNFKGGESASIKNIAK